MPSMSAKAQAATSKTVEGAGVIEGLNAKAGTITLKSDGTEIVAIRPN